MLNSLEFGVPPLYAEVNKAVHEKDTSQLKTLGPFIKALATITSCVDSQNGDDHVVATGKIQGGIISNLAGAFLLMKGASMRAEHIEAYENNLCIFDDDKSKPHSIRIPGFVSCTRDLNVALSFAMKNPKPQYQPVLFMITCQNYRQPQGILVENEAHTAYLHESEYLLLAGTEVFVLAVQGNYLLKSKYFGFEHYNEKMVTIIHLFLNGPLS